MVKTLNRKLLREIWLMKGQVFAITLVVMSGVATFIMFISTMHSLDFTRSKFYREYNFADVFVNLKRAPESLRDKIKNINGVNQVETRVCANAKLDIKGFKESVTGRITSIPDDGNPLINRLYVRSGRLPDPFKDNEVVINETFAQAHGFKLGDQFAAVINGKWKKLTITGIVLSPEFILLMKTGAMTPDFKRYGALWMSRKAISKAYDMEGAFNDVVLTVYPGTPLSDVVRDLDDVLGRYGGFGAYGLGLQSFAQVPGLGGLVRRRKAVHEQDRTFRHAPPFSTASSPAQAGPGGDPQTAPTRCSSAHSSAVWPSTSTSTSSVCSPRRGGGRRTAAGVAESL